MARVIDLTAADEGILQRTEPRGLLSGGRLCAAPLATHLAADEEGRYLARNRSAGLTVSGPDGEETIEPDRGYRAFALLTDRRILFVAGREGGDETVSLPLADVIDVHVESAGVLASQLAIEAADGRTYAFPCRGDLGEFAATVSDDAAAWAHAERLLEDAERDVGSARERLGMAEFDVAREALAKAEERWTAALETVETVHPAAVDGLAERIDDRRERADALRRRIEAADGAIDHAAAQAAWAADEFERAAGAYDRAVQAYRTCLGLPGDEPTDKQLRSRLRGAAGERAILTVAPLVDAQAAKRRAQETDDADVRAAAWETALERYRRAIGLAWPGDGAFRVDRDEIREAAAEAADAAIDARRQAGRQWLAAADKLAATQGVDAASRIYERAAAHFQDALALARSVFPDREEEIEGLLADVERRRTGEIDVAAEPTEAPLPVESVAEALEVLRDDVTLPPAGTSDAAPVPTAPDEAASEAEAPPQEVASAGTTDGSAEPPPTGVGDAAGALADRDPDALLERLRDLPEPAFRQLVADVWSERGWSTTVFTASDAAVYDVLGADTDSGERLLVWTIQAGPDDRLSAGVVERVRTTLDRSRGADLGAIVTTGPVSEPTVTRGSELGVAVVDGEAFCDLLAATDLLDRVPPAA